MDLHFVVWILHIYFPPLSKYFPNNQNKLIGNKIRMKNNKHILADHGTLKAREDLFFFLTEGVVAPLLCQWNVWMGDDKMTVQAFIKGCW